MTINAKCPSGLRGEAIAREGRRFALVDGFDALTSARGYKPAIGIEEALTIMENGRGSHFAPTLYDRFKEMVPDLARRLSRDEAALTALLMNRLQPYLDRLVSQGPAFRPAA
jgi:HD-GYP domain-containing protein (c-di-GMP phosphodiesterase class II)